MHVLVGSDDVQVRFAEVQLGACRRQKTVSDDDITPGALIVTPQDPTFSADVPVKVWSISPIFPKSLAINHLLRFAAEKSGCKITQNRLDEIGSALLSTEYVDMRDIVATAIRLCRESGLSMVRRATIVL